MTDEGAVVSMIGGRDFQASQTNLATNNFRPQAGSTFKPFVLAAALQNDVPVSQRYPGPAKKVVDFPDNPPYEVDNYGGESFGSIDLTTATAHSVNTVYAQLAADLGLDKVAATAHELGVTSDLPMVPSMSLGAANVSPYEMIRSYMTFANRGTRVQPFYVRRVTDANGNELYTNHRDTKRVYDQKYADVVNNVLSQVIKRGTGTAANFGKPAAGKTGTTSFNTDAWFVGYTPKIGTAVWMGYSAKTTRTMDNVHGRAVTGGTFPAQIWQRYMKAATQGMDTGAFTPPDNALLNAPSKGSTDPTTTSSTDTTTTTVPDSSTTTSTSIPADGSTTTTSTPGATSTTLPPGTSTTTTTSRSGAARSGGPPTTSSP
jgi:membrane peptidoglycan carboxypeptidase